MSNTSEPTRRLGEWPMTRHDVRLTGRASAADAIRQLAELWRHHLDAVGEAGNLEAGP